MRVAPCLALLLAVAAPQPAPAAPSPTRLRCDLLEGAEKAEILSARPSLGWAVPSGEQAAYQILVAPDRAALDRDRGDLWDSGRVASSAQAVPYGGTPFAPGTGVAWKVRIWDASGAPGPWSASQAFKTGRPEPGRIVSVRPLEVRRVPPTARVRRPDGTLFLDFGRAAFGTLELKLSAPAGGGKVEVHLGEKRGAGDAVDRKPGGTIRYRRVDLPLEAGSRVYTLAIPPDKRNTGRGAIRMPEGLPEVLPFRYAEIAGLPGDPAPDAVVQLAVEYPFDESAASFRSSSRALDDVWALCKHSIRATTFCGIYVDGDRERIPYEADAYLNQLCHYGVDAEYAMARRSLELLIRRPAWPTEWILHTVLMAHADWEHTGDTRLLEAYWPDLRAKTLDALAREDGLISTAKGRVTDEVLRSIHILGNPNYIHGEKLRDIVDWPAGERDGYQLVEVNTVVNAFHACALGQMARMAEALAKRDEAAAYRAKAERARRAINERLVDATRGLYVDGEGTPHAALHANMMPLAFGLVPEARRNTVAGFVKSRGMACSVYGAQYLLEALYAADEDEAALRLMTSDGDRGWLNMIRAGSTITLEAWDIKYKPNLDWNHAWGAAPANIIPRWLLGVRPLAPGFAKILVQPRPGPLTEAEGVVPTIRGPVKVAFRNAPGTSFRLAVTIPGNTTARVGVPDLGKASATVTVDEKAAEGTREGRHVFVEVGAGDHVVERR
jgi:hypothetical protein